MRTSERLVEFVVLDFKDAFKQLRVHANERRYLAGRHSRGWFLYLRILLGIASGPLVWEHVAAAIMHATQSMAPPAPNRLHYPHHQSNSGALNLACYVDDPFVTAHGTR